MAMAHLVRIGVLPSLLPFAKAMEKFTNLINWGQDRGGMFIELHGLDFEDKETCYSWDLIAEGNDNPFILAIAAAALIRRWLIGEMPKPGARPSHEELELSDFQPFFDRLVIRHSIRKCQ